MSVNRTNQHHGGSGQPFGRAGDPAGRGEGQSSFQDAGSLPEQWTTFDDLRGLSGRLSLRAAAFRDKVNAAMDTSGDRDPQPLLPLPGQLVPVGPFVPAFEGSERDYGSRVLPATDILAAVERLLEEREPSSGPSGVVTVTLAFAGNQSVAPVDITISLSCSGLEVTLTNVPCPNDEGLAASAQALARSLQMLVPTHQIRIMRSGPAAQRPDGGALTAFEDPAHPPGKRS